jgi:RNA recognition motif-containing protein
LVLSTYTSSKELVILFLLIFLHFFMDIFVAKLNSDTTADQIKELFSQYGKVSSSKLIMDRETGMSKCYGFVEMEDESEGAAAIEHLNDTSFMGNYIIVKQSEPRSNEKRSFERRPSFGGGGGGGARRPDGNRGRFGGGGGGNSFNRDRDNRGGGGGGGRDSRRGDYNRYE